MKSVGNAHALGAIGGILKGLGVILVIIMIDYFWRNM